MRGRQQPADQPYNSPFAMTILPGKAGAGKAARAPKDRGPGKTRKPDVAEQFTPSPPSMTPATFSPPLPATPDVAYSAPQPVGAHAGAHVASGPVAASYATDYPAAPGFPPQPHYAAAHLGGDLLPNAGTQPRHGTPGVPPVGYAPLNFLDDHDAPEHESRKSRTPILIAGVLVVALAAGGFYEVPKLLNSKKSSGTAAAVVLPAKIGTLTMKPNTDPTTVSALAAVRKLDPALANVQVGLYGPTASILVMAGQLPKSVVANTSAQQVALIKRIDAAVPTDSGVARNLAAAPLAAGAGEFWCALQPATADTATSTECIGIDSHAVILISVDGPNEAANVRRAMTIRELVEHP